MPRKFQLFLIVFFTLLKTGYSLGDSTALPKINQRQKQILVYSSIGVLYGGIGTGLYQAWYKDYPMGKFHFFNDNREWLQMDKVGHAYSCYAEAASGMNMMKMVGLENKKSIWIGGLIGFGMQSMVEIMDGYSENWGFSWGDVGANVLGTSMAISQQFFWKEQRIKLCYSFHYSDLSQYRPELLGNNFLLRTLKDYNGLTSWLSINIDDLTNGKHMTPWLNIALGYGAYGMLTGDPKQRNQFYSNGVFYDYSQIGRYRKYYLSLDLNLQKISYLKKHPKLFAIARFLAPLKIPMPTIQFDKNGAKFHAFYF